MLVWLVSSMTGCISTYLPNAVNTPLLSEAGEVSADLQGSLNGYNIAAAYAVTDHVGVMVANQFRIGKVSSTTLTGPSIEENFGHLFFEGGAGYFGTIGEIGRYGVYGLFGGGQTKTYDVFIDQNGLSANDTYLRNSYLRTSIVPEIGLSHKVVDVSFNPRFSVVNFIKSTRLSDGAEGGAPYNNVYFEPVTTVRVGYKWVKFTTSLGASFGLIKPTDGYQLLNHQPFIWSVGAHLNFKTKSMK